MMTDDTIIKPPRPPKSPNRKIRCCNCGKTRQIRKDNVDVLYARFNVTNDTELSEVYHCLKCRVRVRLAQKNAFIMTHNKFRILRAQLQKQVAILEESGIMNVRAMNTFRENVNNVLLKNHICHYEYITEKDNLKGIDIKMPFFGRVHIPLLTDKTRFDRRRFYEINGGYVYKKKERKNQQPTDKTENENDGTNNSGTSSDIINNG